LLTGQRVYFTGVVSEAGSILRVPRDRVGEVIEGHGDLGAFLLQEMFRRRQMFLQSRAGVQIVGSRYSPDTQRLREFAARKTNYLLAMIGAEPHTEWLPPELARNEKGFILTGDTVPPAFRKATNGRGWAEHRTCMRRACRAYSPSATSGPAR